MKSFYLLPSPYSCRGILDHFRGFCICFYKALGKKVYIFLIKYCIVLHLIIRYLWFQTSYTDPRCNQNAKVPHAKKVKHFILSTWHVPHNAKVSTPIHHDKNCVNCKGNVLLRKLAHLLNDASILLPVFGKRTQLLNSQIPF